MNQLLFRGKAIEDMSKEELIEALFWAVNKIQQLLDEKKHERDFLLSTLGRGGKI